MKPLAYVDFESEPIKPRPDYPPKAVGVSIILPSKSPKYYAWGHPTQNNCTKSEAKQALKYVYKNYRPVFHNAKFDLEVGEKNFDLPLLPNNGFECTLLLSFLFNPREWSLALKHLAVEHLGMNVNEQDKLHEWLLAHVKGTKQKKSKWGELIYLAPGKLVGRYANKDTLMTRGLYRRAYKYVNEKMAEQYDVEKRIVLKAIKMERVGVRIDSKRLEPDLVKAKRAQKKHNKALIKVLGDVNFNSGPQKVEAFERLGLVDEWEYTDPSKSYPDGQPKTGIESLIEVCNDPKVVRHLQMFSKYNKVISTYMEPWLESAQKNNGICYPWFNTVKGEDDKGTYTGRFSSNWQQVPRSPAKEFKNFPHLRNYIIPDFSSHVLLNRDFAQQELRILAHFEDGELLAAYLLDPKMCVHKFVRALIHEKTTILHLRPHIKTCNFLIVYGGGIAALARKLKIDEGMSRAIISDHREALPGVKQLRDDMMIDSRRGLKFKTAGGRIYEYLEDKEYIAPNTLIQGSAADHTKRQMLLIDDMLEDEFTEARMMLTVHDEFMVSGPRRQSVKLMIRFKERMEADKMFGLPMLSDGKIGPCWGNMEKCA